MIEIKRVYNYSGDENKPAFLVDRFWPRGIKKENLANIPWLKEAAPSPGLCKWFSHDPEKWPDFIAKYEKELDAKPETWQPILEAARKNGVTLVYSARDEAHNNAVVLKNYLEKKMK